MSNATNWSQQQRAIFSWFHEGQGNLGVRARAGTGKTTTIIEAIRYAPELRILVCAFNKRIAKELERKLANPNAEAKTLHSLGYGFIRRRWEGLRIDAKSRPEFLSRAALGDQAPDEIIRTVSALHTKGREMAPLARSGEELRALAYEFDLVPEPEWEEDGYDLDAVLAAAYRAMEIAASRRPATGIDFADMLYLPIRNGWVRPTYDLVVVDEAQDMNATQLLLAQGACRGRMVVVGDDRQAIYGFRGADSGALDRLIGELKAKELGLTTTYRCGRLIVEAAQELVPDYRAADGAPDGLITKVSVEGLLDQCRPGDFVLSRKNAPLASAALKILRTGKRCRIEGRDIGAGLRRLIRKLATGKARSSMPELLARLTRWADREVARATKSDDNGAEIRIERILDKAETIRVLADGLSGVKELLARLEDLFADDGRPAVVCSSVHRAKGLEADRVFVLAGTLMPPVQCKTCNRRHFGDRDYGHAYVPDPAAEREEQNIKYVAITRARRHLTWVHGDV